MIFHPKHFQVLEFLIAQGIPFEPLREHERPILIFTGYSNVGKSSLINALCKRKTAHVSKTPGKTQSINTYYHPTSPFCLIDLPGFGFSAVTEVVRQNWTKMMEELFKKISGSVLVVNIVDGRRGLRDLDHEIEKYCSNFGFKFLRIYNKSDELNQSQKSKYKNELLISAKNQRDFRQVFHKFEEVLKAEDIYQDEKDDTEVFESDED